MYWPPSPPITGWDERGEPWQWSVHHGARPSSFHQEGGCKGLPLASETFSRFVDRSRISDHRDPNKQSRQNGDQRGPQEGDWPSEGAGDRKSTTATATATATANLLTTKQQLLALEKLGALPTDAADEVRNIVAEGIADKFSQPYRSFPCAREGTEIRRDAVPKRCALRTSVEGLVANAW